MIRFAALAAVAVLASACAGDPGYYGGAHDGAYGYSGRPAQPYWGAGRSVPWVRERPAWGYVDPRYAAPYYSEPRYRDRGSGDWRSRGRGDGPAAAPPRASPQAEFWGRGDRAGRAAPPRPAPPAQAARPRPPVQGGGIFGGRPSEAPNVEQGAD